MEVRDIVCAFEWHYCRVGGYEGAQTGMQGICPAKTCLEYETFVEAAQHLMVSWRTVYMK
jgi:hypothetical protein